MLQSKRGRRCIAVGVFNMYTYVEGMGRADERRSGRRDERADGWRADERTDEQTGGQAHGCERTGAWTGERTSGPTRATAWAGERAGGRSTAHIESYSQTF